MTMAQREICALLERAIDELPEAFHGVLVARFRASPDSRELFRRGSMTL